MKGWIVVSLEVVHGDDYLHYRIHRAVSIVSKLPGK
jgi:hypothetical protein